ncbi:MAG: hypothetical protein IK129_07180, partial [Deltaproteobacteria bacterium]|nr:hypothetical protein [Deltaproteobacteria bacterium]
MEIGQYIGEAYHSLEMTSAFKVWFPSWIGPLFQKTKKEENNEKTGHAVAGGDAAARRRAGGKADADAG